MSDICDELRSLYSQLDPYAECQNRIDYRCVAHCAADEIERLRELLREVIEKYGAKEYLIRLFIADISFEDSPDWIDNEVKLLLKEVGGNNELWHLSANEKIRLINEQQNEIKRLLANVENAGECKILEATIKLLRASLARIAMSSDVDEAKRIAEDILGWRMANEAGGDDE